MPEMNPSGSQEMDSGDVTLRGEKIYQNISEF